jgi:CRP-like cAMP-binding protein
VRARWLEKVALLGEFDADDRDALAGLLAERSLGAGERLFEEGEEARGLVLVAEGALKLESRRLDGSRRVGSGHWLGAAALVTVGGREVTATATEPTRLLELDRLAFRRLVEDAPRTACRLLEAVLMDLADGLRPTLERMALRGVDPRDSGP